MACSVFDVRDYFFGELPESERGPVEAHLAACSDCATELDQLRALRGNLMMLRDEEAPRRIGFVSDKIFEPSPVRRWIGGFWLSGARLGFASAAMLSVGLLAYSLRQQPNVIERRVEVAAAAPASGPDVKALVAQAVSAAMVEQDKKTRALLLANDRKHTRQEREVTVVLSDYISNLEKQNASRNKMQISSISTPEGLR